MPKFSPVVTMTLLGVSVLAIAGCSGNDVRQSLGLRRNNPDEFQVIARPPLSVPPVYHLRPPMEGVTREVPADKRASSLVLEGKELPNYYTAEDTNNAAAADTRPYHPSSQGESTLLQNAGADEAQSDIRSLLRSENNESQEQSEKEKSVLDRMKLLRDDKRDPVVDAKAEAERIRTNKNDGKPLNEGNVPVIDPKEKSVLDRIFE